jgi:hypothetical protein
MKGLSMKHVFRIVMLVTLAFTTAAQASDPSFRITDILDGSLKVKQTLVYMSESDCEKKTPKKIRPLMKLPGITHQIIDPLTMFGFSEKGLEQIFYPVEMNNYGILKAKDYATVPYILTTGLCECVGVGIQVAGVQAGIMHVGFAGIRHKFSEFLGHFPKSTRAKAKVTLMSTFYTVLLEEVCEKLTKNGFHNISADVVPIYLDCQDRTSSGTKYYSYERLNFTKEDAHRLSQLSSQEVIKAVEERAGLSMLMTESDRMLILDLQTGASCQFYPQGFGAANSQMVHMLYELRRKVEGERRLDPKTFMTRIVAERMQEVHEAVAYKVKSGKKFAKKEDVNNKLNDKALGSEQINQ